MWKQVELLVCVFTAKVCSIAVFLLDMLNYEDLVFCNNITSRKTTKIELNLQVFIVSIFYFMYTIHCECKEA